MKTLKTKWGVWYYDGERLLKKRTKKSKRKEVDYYESWLKAPLEDAIKYIKEVDRTDQVSM
jgi:hypothetical protein